MAGMMPNMQMGGSQPGGGNMNQMPNQMFNNLQQYPHGNGGMGMNNNNAQGGFGPMVPNGYSQDYNNRA